MQISKDFSTLCGWMNNKILKTVQDVELQVLVFLVKFSKSKILIFIFIWLLEPDGSCDQKSLFKTENVHGSY